METAVNELAAQLGVDPIALRERNMVREGMAMPAYYGEVTNACALDRCLARGRERRLGREVPRCATWEAARCAPPAWPCPCRARAFPALTWGRLP